MIYTIDQNLLYNGISYKDLKLEKGDCVLFKRGSLFREGLKIVQGISYGAWGDGENPIFCGSTNLSSPDFFEKTDTPNVWRCTKEIEGDVGNFVFDGECNATFCWEKDELMTVGAFYDSRASQGERRQRKYDEQELLIYCPENPGKYYSDIECISYKERILGTLVSYVTLENLTFKNVSVHALAGEGTNITIRGCRFENIGGSGWNRDMRVRFGNAIEFWYCGKEVSDILIESCTFKNVYDSCVTYQGPKNNTAPCRNFICRNCIFDTFSMAAAEYRDCVPIDSIFENNVCRNAGCGFGTLGDTVPRNSVIYPEPMGHHIFIWRMDSANDGGNLIIKNNAFENAPVGAAIFSIASPDAESQIHIENNTFEENGKLLIRWGGKDFKTVEEFEKAIF